MEKRLNNIFDETTKEELSLFKKAAEIIKADGLVAFPTETVYGLGANALNENAVKKIYEAKGRPSDNPLILHVSGLEMAESLVHINETAKLLMNKFWPGPLSLVLNAKDIIPLSTRGGLPTAAIRMPDNRIALELIRISNLPIAAPSANKSGRPSPTDAKTVRDDIGDSVEMIIDGGKTLVGLESTVLDITGENPVLLRPGAISKEEIEAVLNVTVLFSQDENIIKRSPGVRYRHYAPNIPLVLSDVENALKYANGRKWAWIGTSEPKGTPNTKIIFINTNEYAKELFRVLREIETTKVEVIIAEKPEQKGIGLALTDRLIKAAGN
ncbi:MAG: threonylcarbamoyl-AMP synthase [Synergistaceae bacterium]|nr:threonylcarbamoyl-AMP synthase [Synergistaceae bacterium]